MADQLTLNVNERDCAITCSTDTPLLYVLRNELRLSGPRYGCGVAQCGACAVLVDGAEVRSCITPIAGVVGIRESDGRTTGISATHTYEVER